MRNRDLRLDLCRDSHESAARLAVVALSVSALPDFTQ